MTEKQVEQFNEAIRRKIGMGATKGGSDAKDSTTPEELLERADVAATAAAQAVAELRAVVDELAGVKGESTMVKPGAEEKA